MTRSTRSLVGLKDLAFVLTRDFLAAENWDIKRNFPTVGDSLVLGGDEGAGRFCL